MEMWRLLRGFLGHRSPLPLRVLLKKPRERPKQGAGPRRGEGRRGRCKARSIEGNVSDDGVYSERFDGEGGAGGAGGASEEVMAEVRRVAVKLVGNQLKLLKIDNPDSASTCASPIQCLREAKFVDDQNLVSLADGAARDQ